MNPDSCVITKATRSLPSGGGGGNTRVIAGEPTPPPAEAVVTLDIINNTGETVNFGGAGGCGNGSAKFSTGGSPESVNFGEILNGATLQIQTVTLYDPNEVTSVWVDAFTTMFMCIAGSGLPRYATQTGTHAWTVTLT